MTSLSWSSCFPIFYLLQDVCNWNEHNTPSSPALLCHVDRGSDDFTQSHSGPKTRAASGCLRSRPPGLGRMVVGYVLPITNGRSEGRRHPGFSRRVVEKPLHIELDRTDCFRERKKTNDLPRVCPMLYDGRRSLACFQKSTSCFLVAQKMSQWFDSAGQQRHFAELHSPKYDFKHWVFGPSQSVKEKNIYISSDGVRWNEVNYFELFIHFQNL